MSVKLLTEHHLKFLSLKGAAQTRPSLHLSKCWKSHVTAHLCVYLSVFYCLFSSNRNHAFANSEESDLECISRVYFEKRVRLAL